MMDNDRAAFEEWASDNGKWPNSIIRSADSYRLAQTAHSWRAWQAAWQAAIAHAVPPGHVVVPDEPTLEMIEAGTDCMTCASEDVWSAMIAAAPDTHVGGVNKMGDADIAATVREAIDEYYAALDRREHGGIAQNRAFDKMQHALGMYWDQGASLPAAPAQGEK